MAELFPIIKRPIRSVTLDLSNPVVADCVYMEGDRYEMYQVFQGCLKIAHGRGADNLEVYAIKDKNSGFKRTISFFFKETKGKMDLLTLNTKLIEKWGKEDPNFLPKIKELIDGRPISTTFFMQDWRTSKPMNITPTYFREYVDFKMYGANFDEDEPLELSGKLLNCELLFLQCTLKNPEKLKEFKGWGLILNKPEEKGFPFDFYCSVVMDWHSGKPIQWKFIGLQYRPFSEDDKWNSLAKLGTPEPSKNIYEIEIKIQREDGEICRIIKCVHPCMPQYITTVYFILGEISPGIRQFCSSSWHGTAEHYLLE